MTSYIRNFIQTHRTEADYWTHISLSEPKGKLLFDYEHTDEFFEEYGKIYEKNDYVFGIAERPGNVIPILVDVDLNVDVENRKSLYDEDLIKNVISEYVTVIREIVNNVQESDLVCVCLEKEGYVSNGRYKNGFHLHFPKIFLQKKDHNDFLIPKVKSKLENIFKDYKIDDVIDKGYVTAPWLLYGCGKNNKKGYDITKIYNGNLEELNIYDLVDYKIYNKDNEQITLTKNNIKKNIPRILSIQIWGREDYIKDLKEELQTIKIKQAKKKNKHKTNKYKYTNDKQLSSKLLNIISPDKADDHNYNFMIGQCLYNIFNGSNDGLKHWITFSEKIQRPHKTRGTPGNLNVKYFENTWLKMDTTDSTIATLRYFAKLDNHKQYEKVMNEEANNHLNSYIEFGGTHYDIAKTLHTKYSNMFVCSSLRSKGDWYMFENHVWKNIEDGINLRRLISTEIITRLRSKDREIDRELTKLRKTYYNDDEDQDDNDDEDLDSEDEDYEDRNRERNNRSYVEKREKLEAKQKHIRKTIQECKKAIFKNNVMTEACELFYDPSFRHKLGSNKHMIAFNNGVYDLKTKTFRDGLPSDYMFKKSPINFNEYKQSDPEIKSLNKFLQQIFPNKRLLKYALDYHSDLFVGGNPRKIALIYQGDGNNGKSIFQSVIEGMFGSDGIGYAAKLNTTFLTGKKQASGGPQPDLDRLRHGCRLVVLQEPSKQEVINTALLKELSGNDTMYCRTLYKEGGEFLPYFCPIIICNDLPKLSSNEPAIWSRLRLLPFESKFDTEQAPTTYEEQLEQKIFPRDEDLNNKLAKFMSPLAFTLINCYNNRNGKSYDEPPEVTNATNKYQHECDLFKQYIDERIFEIKEKNKKDNTFWIRLSDMYPDFKMWWSESISNQKVPNKNELKDYLNNNKVWGKYALPASKWYGFRFKTIDDEVDEI